MTSAEMQVGGVELDPQMKQLSTMLAAMEMRMTAAMKPGPPRREEDLQSSIATWRKEMKVMSTCTG